MTMIIRKEDRFLEKRECPVGGTGVVMQHHFLSKEDSCNTGRLFAINELQPNSSVGEHTHKGDFEIYVILEGTAVVRDNGVEQELHEGDVMLCRDGDSHSMENRTDKPIKFLAIVLYTPEKK